MCQIFIYNFFFTCENTFIIHSNVLFTSHLDSRLMVFNKINIFFFFTYELGNVTIFCPFIFKVFRFFMFRGVEKTLVYQKIINVSTHH
jgi:hypothetical protein